MTGPKPCSLLGQQKVFYIATGGIASCCRAHPENLDTNKTIEDYINHWAKQKNLLDHGVQITPCEICWKDELQNQISFRQQTLGKATDNVFELYVSNACNQMCSYCSPKYSSTWQESIESRGEFQRVSASAKQNQQIHNTSKSTVEYWLKEIRNYISTCNDRSIVIKLLGGEPLMQQKNLQNLLEFDLNKVKTLQIHTNLAPPNNKFLKWVLDSFPSNRLEFNVSLDATPIYNHIPRGNFNATEFNKNLQLIQANGISMRIMSVLSVLGIFDLPNFIPWLTSNQIENIFQKIYHPDCLDPLLVPINFRKQIAGQLNNFKLSPIVSEVLTTEIHVSDVRLLEQYNYLTQYFERVNINVLSIENSLFQEYWNWLSLKFSKGLSTNM